MVSEPPAAVAPGEAPLEAAAPTAVSGLQKELDEASRRWVDSTMASLTLAEEVGQLVFPWIPGGYAARSSREFQELAAWVEEDRIGGVAISIGSPLSYAAKLNALQELAELPLLVTSDFENGGPGMRINHSYALPSLLAQGGGTSFPPTMAFGALGDDQLVYEYGRVTGVEARAVGVHLIFAPVLDVNSNPENPIINTRAFGEDPHEVARLGSLFMAGARAGGVLTTAKHFPGHGDTRIDSHLALPEVEAHRARLDSVELIPFQRAIREGVDAVMTAHLSMPNVLGPGAPPATLSPELMTGLLREEMGFQGLLFTDALRMGAITDGYGAGEAAVLALEAGADVILIPEDVGQALQAVESAVTSGRVPRDRVRASVRRILEAKARVGLHRGRAVSLEGVDQVVGSGEHLALADSSAARAITLPRDREALIPVDPARVGRVLSVTYARSTDLPAGRAFDAALRTFIPGLESARVHEWTPTGEWDDLVHRAYSADLVIVGGYLPPQAGAGTVGVPEPLVRFVDVVEGTRPLVLISFGSPYILSAVPQVGSYLVAWGDREVAQVAAAQALVGATGISGRLPISIPPLHTRGEGLVRESVPGRAMAVGTRGDALDETGIVARGRDGGTPERPLPDSHGAEASDGWLERDPFLPMTRSLLEADPRELGMSPQGLEALDALVLEAVADSASPGAAVAVLRRGRLVRLRGYGDLAYPPGSGEVTPHSVYDLASLTKVVATTLAVQLLMADGAVELDAPVAGYLPGWEGNDPRKLRVTVRDLLLHRGGLPPFRQFFRDIRGRRGFRQAMSDLPLDMEPGTRTVYSDIGFKTLGLVVEEVSGLTLDRFLQERAWGPLRLESTTFRPPVEWRDRIAPTEVAPDFRSGPLLGEVHDENSWAMGGVAGHAGLFSSVFDLARLTALLAGGGSLPACEAIPGSGSPCPLSGAPAVSLLSPEVMDTFTRSSAGPGSRALGWDTPSGRSSAGDYFSVRSWGHTGFTGTSIWVDPELDLAVVLLTNRVHPHRDNTRHIPLRRAVHDAAARAVVDREVRER